MPLDQDKHILRQTGSLRLYKPPEHPVDLPVGTTLKVPVMLTIPGGDYWIGTSDENIQYLQRKQGDWAYDWSDQDLFEYERPKHRVRIAIFNLAQNPVTNEAYYQFTVDTGYRLPRSWNGFVFPEEYAVHPVTGVSKIDVEAYLSWLNQKTGQDYRLPTEEEWEAAARGLDDRIYPWGNAFDPWRCNTSESIKKGTTQVGNYSPSGDSSFGLMDMVGNVWEWTSSVFRAYPGGGIHEPEGQPAITRYVVRGGSWYYSRKFARCSAREGAQAEYSSHSLGFRIAGTPGKFM
jgi:toxoflavin biosynthesis protein ToxD